MPFARLDERPTRGPFAHTAKIVAMTGLMALGAAHYLARASNSSGQYPSSRIAAIPGDPEVTGSITEDARRIGLDPCVIRKHLIGR